MALTAEQLLSLKTEIDTDPLNLGLIGAGDAKAARLHTELVAFQDYLALTTTEAKALQYMLNAASSINMALSRVRDIIESLTINEVLSTATRDTLLRLGEVRQSRSQELFETQITAYDIQEARGA